jgi:hypothetical protein
MSLHITLNHPQFPWRRTENKEFDMLSDDEARELYEKLSEWLRAHDRASLADDVAREIAIGRRVSRKISIPSESSDSTDSVGRPPRRESRTSADFVGRDPFTAIESLALLIDGIELSIVSPGMMAEKLLQTIGTDSSVADLAIASDDPSSDIYRVRHSDVATSTALAEQLRSVLVELRAEIHMSLRSSPAPQRAGPSIGSS